MALAFENKYRKVFQKEYQYAVNDIVYIRGTQEGYNATRTLYDSHLQSAKVKNKIKMNAQAMMQRYVNLRNEALSLRMGAEGKFSEKGIISMQEKWVDALVDGLSTASGNLSESTAFTMKQVQQALATLAQNGEKKTLEEIHNLVVELEKQFNNLSPNDKRDLAGLIYDSNAIEGKIVNIRNGEIVFSRMKNTLQRLSRYSSIKVGSAMRATNAEFGALGEVMDTFALAQATKCVQDMLGKNFGNVKVQQTGSTQVRDEYGKVGTGTTDALFTYEGAYNGKDVTFDFGVSLKTTGTVLGENGKWVQKPTATEIKIKSISAQYKLWNQISTALGIGQYSTRMENSVLNTLVWTNSQSNSYKIITKSLLAAFFEKYIAGGNMLTNGLGIDIADVIMVNGVPIPITAIISTIIEQLEDDSFLTKNKSLAFMEVDVDNKWKGTSNNIMDAIQRSQKTKDIIKKSLQARVYLNGNMLYNIAKQYMK